MITQTSRGERPLAGWLHCLPLAGAMELQGLQPSQLRVLAGITARLVREEEASAVYAGVLDGVLQLMAADHCAVFRRNEATKVMECVASHGVSSHFISRTIDEASRATAEEQNQLDVLVFTVGDQPEDKRATELLKAEKCQTGLYAPVAFQDRVIGALVALFDEPRQVPEAERQLIRFFATLAGAASENSRAHTESLRRSERLRVVNEIALALSSTLDPDELYQAIYEQIRRVITADCFYVGLWDPDRESISFPFAMTGGERTHPRDVMLDDGLSSWVVRNRVPRVVPDVAALKASGETIAGVSAGVASTLHVPMLLGERVVGVISAQCRERGMYGDDDVQMLQTIAGQAAVALQNAGMFAAQKAAIEENRRLRELSEARAHRAAVLSDVGVALSRVLDPDELYDVVYTQTSRVLKVDAFFIALWDENRQSLAFPFEMDGGVRIDAPDIPFGEGPSCRVIRDATPLALNREGEIEADAGRMFGSNCRSRSMIYVPMMLGDRVIGVISAQSYEPNAYADEDVQMLQTVASQTAVALVNARLFRTQCSALEENARLHEDSARRAEQLRILNEAGLALSEVLEMDSLGEVVFQQASRILAVDCFYIALWNPERETLTYSFFDKDRLADRNIEAPIGDGPSGWVIRNRKPHLTLTEDDPVHKAGSDYGNGIVKSACHVPLMLGDRVTGVMSVQSYRSRSYTDEDVQILQMLAGQAAVAAENARLYRAVQEASLTDDLTGLPNRRAISQRLADELSRACRYGYSLSVLILDLDFFKSVNDTFGHPTGDTALRELSTLLRASLRSHDALGRWGGEEFMVILVHTDLEGARVVAENLRARVERYPFLGGRLGRPLTVSLGGVAIEPLTSWDAGMAIDAADAHLYEAKSSGRNCAIIREG